MNIEFNKAELPLDGIVNFVHFEHTISVQNAKIVECFGNGLRTDEACRIWTIEATCDNNTYQLFLQTYALHDTTLYPYCEFSIMYPPKMPETILNVVVWELCLKINAQIDAHWCADLISKEKDKLI